MNNILEEKPITLGSNLFQYISEVNKIPILTEEEELDYAQKKDKGDINAAKMLISTHLRLVVKISSNYKNYGLPMMDIISEGNIGLMRAVKTFDYRKGYKLATYAMWWIKAYIQEYILRSWSIVRIGTNSAQKKLFFNLKKIKNNILQNSNRKYLNNNDIQYISNTFNILNDDIINMDMRITKGDLYLNNKVKSSEDNTEILDLLPSKQALPDVIVDNKRTNIKNMKLLQEAITKLDDREKEIISLRRLKDKPLTLAEISKMCNISGERVRQIEAKALDKIRSYILHTVK